MQVNIYILVASSFLVVTNLFACSEEVAGPAYLEIEEGGHLPCLGMKRVRVVVSDGQSQTRFDNFGEFYDDDGHCRQTIYAHASFEGLNTGTMMVTVEGFDSSEKRRIALGAMGPIIGKDVDRGYLGTVVVDREPVYVGGSDRYPLGTLVVDALPQIDAVGNIDNISFIVNAGKPDSINGRFLTDPEMPLEDTELVISSISPFDPPGDLAMIARNKNVSVGQWANASAFTIEENDTFVDVAMAKEQ